MNAASALRRVTAVRTLVAALILAVCGAAILWSLPDPFTPLFRLALTLIAAAVLFLPLALAIASIRARWRWARVVGWLCVAIVSVAALALAIVSVEHRWILFRPVPAGAWGEDLAFLTGRIGEMHPDPFAHVTRAEFDSAAARLRADLPRLSEAQRVARFTALVAMLRDGHTTMAPFLPTTGFRMLPLQVEHFSDGLFVTAAGGAHADLSGQRIVRIGGSSIEDAFARLQPLVAADNETAVLGRIGLYYVTADLLHALGLSDRADRIVLTLRDTAGRETVREVGTVSAVRYFYWYLDPLQRWRPRQDDLPLARRDRWKHYWAACVDSPPALYVQFNVVRPARDESLDAFARRLDSMVAECRAERVVFDLRNNGGGDNTTYGPLLRFIERHPAINRRGHLFALIGRHTFSAAVNFVTRLEQKTNALFVGEPAGAGPNHFGDSEHVILPRSRNPVFISTRRWQLADAGDTRTAHEPHIRVVPSSADHFAGRDPVLAAALGTAR